MIASPRCLVICWMNPNLAHSFFEVHYGLTVPVGLPPGEDGILHRRNNHWIVTHKGSGMAMSFMKHSPIAAVLDARANIRIFTGDVARRCAYRSACFIRELATFRMDPEHYDPPAHNFFSSME